RSSTFYSPLLCFTRRATPDTSALSLHDALPISAVAGPELLGLGRVRLVQDDAVVVGQLLARGDVADGLDEDAVLARVAAVGFLRSEEHTSELQSRENLVCRLLLDKKKNVIDTSE